MSTGPSVPPELAPGGFPYRMERPVGVGASSRVWLAKTSDGARVALKVAIDARHAARFADEAERLLFVGSPSLTAVVGVGTIPSGLTDAGHPYIALEWAPGDALDVGRERSPSERRALALVIARDVGEALADLHAAGVAHGDVKPANIVVSTSAKRPRARLVDLGLGADADQTSPRGGTARYLAPEVFETDRASSGRARDLYALGVVLSELAGDHAEDVAAIARTLVSPAPGARPSAKWVRNRALAALGEPVESRAERSERAIERSYLALRRRELLVAAARARVDVRVGEPVRAWIQAALAIAKPVVMLRGAAEIAESIAIDGLDTLGRARWLVSLVGPSASRWQMPRVADDADLARRLVTLARQCEPEAFTRIALDAGQLTSTSVGDDPIEIALALGAGETPALVLDRAERLIDGEHPALALMLALGRALRRRGELGRAVAVLARSSEPAARVEMAEALRRAGDVAGAERVLDSVEIEPGNAAARARRAATLARIELDRGGRARAKEIADGEPISASTSEIRALIALAASDRATASETIAQGLAVATNDEERARLEAVRGSILHSGGEASEALEAFRRAVDHAVRAGAVLEEATYLTGLSAAAADEGELGEALAASARAVLLFEHLGRAREAARAALTRASVFSQAGAIAETRIAAEDAMIRARSAGDARCRAYAHLALADVLEEDDREALEHAERAEALLVNPVPDDALRVGARLHRRGKDVDLASLDALAHGAAAALDARLEWWGARALVEARRDRPQRPESLIAELGAVASERAPLAVRGPALAAGAKLAARAGDGDRARHFSVLAREAARELVKRAPPELRSAVEDLEWTRSLEPGQAPGVSSEQLADVETLVRALGSRDRLGVLLGRVLDALILWTGVERGLLLLRAPGGKLVPRAARNIARADLSREQLALSTTLAERAAELGETVVAVDAAGELPDVHASVHALKLRSVLAVPLVARGETFGVVYLDDRVRRGAFGPPELAWVRLVAALASIAIAEARDQLLLRRAARRARRAEARLAADLAAREAELDVAERELARARDARDTRFSYDRIVGSSEALKQVLRLVDRVALSEVPVLVVGESGSGKELIARAIHENGPRAERPFVSENCGAIPEGLLESTLFGHVRGAFTGASRPRAGLFDIADGGTLFLDEIGEMSLGMQTKLLRVLENGELHPVGSDRGRHVDVRVIGATHRDLEALVAEGKFRQDLLYRLNVISVTVPPLRERPSDIPILVRHFITKHAMVENTRISRNALDRLVTFPWPGNVRQLENEIRRALVLADDLIDVEHLSPELRGVMPKNLPEHELDLRARVDGLEAELVRTALERTGGNQTRAAELLGLSRFGLQKMMKRLEIESSSPPGRRMPGAVLTKR